jgi:hypothetical protein
MQTDAFVPSADTANTHPQKDYDAGPLDPDYNWNAQASPKEVAHEEADIKWAREAQETENIGQ